VYVPLQDWPRVIAPFALNQLTAIFCLRADRETRIATAHLPLLKVRRPRIGVASRLIGVRLGHW
jgi:hypothetical protein